MVRCKAIIEYRDNVIPIEEIIGITEDFIFFNPEVISKEKTEFKIQSPELLILIGIKDQKTYKLEDLEEFEIMDTKGSLILDSTDLKSDAVNTILDQMSSPEDLSKSVWN